jgi:hypothetical protein
MLTFRRKRTTYPAVANGKCDSCTTKGIVCHGLAGKSCEECSRIHSGCSNTGMYFFFLRLDWIKQLMID